MSSTPAPAPVTLKPDVRLPLLVVALFGLFLLIQSASLRLEFKKTL